MLVVVRGEIVNRGEQPNTTRGYSCPNLEPSLEWMRDHYAPRPVFLEEFLHPVHVDLRIVVPDLLVPRPLQ